MSKRFPGVESISLQEVQQRKLPIDIQTFFIGDKIGAEVLVLNLAVKIAGEFDTVPQAINNAYNWVQENLCKRGGFGVKK